MRLLFVTPVFPGQAYGRRPYNFIKVLAPKHSVDLICASAKPISQAEIQAIKDMGVRTVTIVSHPIWKGALSALGALPRRHPLRAGYCESGSMSRAVADFLEHHQVDLMHIDRSRMARLATLRPRNTKCVVDFTDAMTLLFERKIQYTRNPLSRAICLWERQTQPRFEQQIAPTFDGCLLCSPVDAKVVEKTVPPEKIHLIPNMVDTDEFTVKRHDGSPRLVFTGTWTYFPNTDSLAWFTETILPRIRNVFPSLETQVIGARPGKSVLRLNGRNGIQVIGAVERMADHLFADDVFVCPLRVGAGVRNKILEAMACGMAVVSTTLGAEGIPVEDGLDIMLADDPQAFAEKIVTLLKNQPMRMQLGAQARKTIIQHHSEATVAPQIENLYESIVASR
ncbi:MAG TPA: glycosyltransferase [bacterium]|nr:glycosyltransferase [bacterium]